MALKNILILGLGGVGMHLAKRLVHEGYAVTIIESDAAAVRYANENLDARLIHGNALELSCWEKAQADRMDLLIAVTDNDALNMLSSVLAHRYGIRIKIVRARSLDFDRKGDLVTEDLKVDLMIHPEELVAQEISRLVQRTAGNDVLDAGEGQMKVLGLRIAGNSPLARKTLHETYELFPKIPFKIVAIARGITTIIPNRSHQILPYDHVFIMIHKESIPRLMDLMEIQQQRIHRVMILGGGLVGRRVAELLGKSVKVTVIEKNVQRAETLASSLQHAQVLHGDGTDANVLILGGLVDMDTFITTTGENETNIISCLLAKHLMNKENKDPAGGKGKTIALVNKEDYLVLSSTIGLDVALSAKISASNEILKFIRRNELLSVAHLHGVDAEVVELVASEKSQIIRKPLKKLSAFQEDGITVGGLLRDGHWQMAQDETQIQPNDRVIIVCNSPALKDVRKLFY